MTKPKSTRRSAQILLLIGSAMIVATIAELVAHFFFGFEIKNKATGLPASNSSIITDSIYFGGIGAIFGLAGISLLRPPKSRNDS
ncbi:hypothetical protein FHS31_001546 [Sphingomonas vulcanisoli]|uniref:DUF3185 family protein n=1 Tax=Sphingomonas vulcanisoli TaxID=1658060 RepID=A0ABX0TQY8_9SPHN|nr:hypothetical protein [Sphingomonas vulcanisoli]NIJ07936.1 hypothetical protein [Sphingomonas vulcanisoli]